MDSSHSDLGKIERLIDQFEEAHRQGLQPSIFAFLNVDEAERKVLLTELVHIDLEIRLKRGEPVLVESYLKQFPELESDQNRLIELLATEYRLRRIQQPSLMVSEYLGRFPQLADMLERRLGNFNDLETADWSNAADTQSTINHSATTSSAVGDTTSLGTRFRILRPHARGGLGQVSVARDEELNRDVALKEIHQRHADDPDLRARFLREAEITGGLEHPSIVPVYGLGQFADGRPYYAMRFIRGDSLEEAIKNYHDLRAQSSNPGELAVELRKLLARFLDVCNAIAYAHSRGVLHRDLKPSNIMLGKYGETLVVDWGLAKALDHPELEAELRFSEELLKPASGSGSTPTEMGSALGTPQYMSPEQAAGRLDLLGSASDVYGLGATLYCLLTGRPPIDRDDTGGNVLKILQKVQQGKFQPPRAVNRQIARPLEAICLKAMALKPERRYSSPRELADDVERWLADEPVIAYREPLLTRAARWGRKHKTLVAGAFGLVTAAAIALAVSAVLIKQEQVQTERARRQADANAATAEENAREAHKQTERAETLRKDAQLQLVLSYIDGAINELEHGEPARGIAVLGQAYRATIEANRPELRRSVCALLGAWQSTCECRLPSTGGEVRAVAFSPDGTKLATATLRGLEDTARLWNAATGQPMGPPRKLGPARGVAFSPDGTKLVTTSRDKTARLWDMRTGQPLGQPLKHDNNEGQFLLLVFNPDGTKLATTAGGRSVRLWDAGTGQLFSQLATFEPRDEVTAVTFSPDSAQLATASWNGKGTIIRRWDAATGQPSGSPLEYDNRVFAVVFSPDGTRIATANGDKTARLWDVQTGRQLGEPLTHGGQVAAVTFSLDGTKLATASRDNTVRLWDVRTGQPHGPPMKHFGNVAVVFSPDGTKLATESGYKTVQLWDAATGQPVGPPMKHDYLVTATIFSPDGAKLATAAGSEARQWEAATGDPIGHPTTHNRGVQVVTLKAGGARFRQASIVFGTTGAKVATVKTDYTVQQWDAGTGQPLDASIDLGSADQVVLSPDGTKLATANTDNTIQQRDAVTGRPLGSPMKVGQVPQVVFSPDSTKLAIAGDKMVRLLDTTTGELLDQPLERKVLVQAVAISPDGAKIVTAEGNEARLWDAATGQPLGQPLGSKSFVRVVVFSPDGTKLATGGYDGTAQLWDVTTGQRLGQPMEHDDEVLAAAFSPDGTKLTTASRDKNARLWDVQTGQPLGPFMKHNDEVLAVAFSPDGTKLATVSSDNTAWLWPVPQSLPDDRQWIAAWLEIVSGYKEDVGGGIHKTYSPPPDDAWREVLRLPAWLDHRQDDANRFARGWHENEAAAHEAADRWFAAAFHLRWLCQLEPDNKQWQQRFANATQQLASAANRTSASRLLAKEAGAGTWSPDNTRIAFTSLKSPGKGIRILTLANNNIEAPTETGKDPAWAPGDGRFIAFTDKKTGDQAEGIWIADLLAKETKRVATGECVCWLADGKTICYRTRIDDKPAIQSLDVNDNLATPKTVLTGFSGVHPVGSPDGQYVVGLGDSELQIWSVAKQEIVDRHSLPGWHEFVPGWSPDSQEVAFGSCGMTDLNDLWTYNLGTHRMTKILAGKYTCPCWSTDGRQMCIDKRESDYSELWLLDLQPTSDGESK